MLKAISRALYYFSACGVLLDDPFVFAETLIDFCPKNEYISCVHLSTYKKYSLNKLEIKNELSYLKKIGALPEVSGCDVKRQKNLNLPPPPPPPPPMKKIIPKPLEDPPCSLKEVLTAIKEVLTAIKDDLTAIKEDLTAIK